MKKKTSLLITMMILVVLAATIAGIYGCGKTNDYQAPNGSTISVTPTSVTWTDLGEDIIQTFQVVVKYSDGTPIPNATVYISGALAVQTSLQYAAYQFYFNKDATNVTPNYPVTGGQFKASTDEFGSYYFSAKLFGATTLGFLPKWKDSVYIYSGTASALLSLETTTS